MNWVRQWTGSHTKRYSDGEFNLDLSYITDRIIAMGFPASGVEAAYRHSAKDVSVWLNRRHKDQYMIFNLSERTYDASLFDDRVHNMGWPDHHGPNLSLLFTVVLTIARWLDADPSNIAVIHCMAGKGRTGTVISALLVCNALFDSADASMEFFGKKRSALALGVQQPSQVRAVRYFSESVLKGFYPTPRLRYLRKVQLEPVPPISHHKGMRPRLQIFNITDGYENKVLLLDTAWSLGAQSLTRLYKSELHSKIAFEQSLPLKGDIFVKCFHVYTRLGRQQQDCIFRCSINTAFIKKDELVLLKSDLDLAHSDSRIPGDFRFTMYFDEGMVDDEDDEYTFWPRVSHEQFVERARLNKKIVEQMGRLFEKSIDEFCFVNQSGEDETKEAPHSDSSDFEQEEVQPLWQAEPGALKKEDAAAGAHLLVPQYGVAKPVEDLIYFGGSEEADGK